MKKSKGQASPELVNKLLKEKVKVIQVLLFNLYIF